MDGRARLLEMRAVERLAARDATLFADPAIAETRLDWIGLPAVAAEEAPGFAAIAADAAAAGVTDVVLLGMGGSSLAPLVLSRSIAPSAGYATLHVLDTTSPSQVRALLDTLTPASTVVIVSSKSGTSIEPLSLHAVFSDWMGATLGDDACAHFIALTDPGTPLEALAAAGGFARTVSTPAGIGGRYAALTPFATLPAAMAGVDVEQLAATAVVVEEACARPDDANPALALAAWLSDAYVSGRDKLSIVCSPSLAAFGLWVEQLVAESTGKLGHGLLPVLEDSPGLAEWHGSDRMTFVLRASDDDVLTGIAGRLPDGEPLFEVVIDDTYALAAEFVHWEWAVALFSAANGIECFDQPDVESAKAATRAILAGERPTLPARTLDSGVRLTVSPGVPADGLDEAVGGLLGSVPPGGYLAVLAYLPEDVRLLAPLRATCAEVSRALHVPVTLELGPRYLHSTGQYHKGGPATGAFLVITAADAEDLDVPGQPFTLAQLHAAQPAGDAAALLERGRPLLEIDLPSLAGLPDVIGALLRAVGA